MLSKQIKRHRRHKKIRAKIKGDSDRPRLCVFKSSNHIYAQIIDDEKSKTIISAKDLEIKISKAKETGDNRKGKVKMAYEVGKLIAQKSADKKITQVVFDRGGNKYHGRIKALAEGAREAGLKF